MLAGSKSAERRPEAYSFVVHAECTRFQRLITLQHHEVSGGRLKPREKALNIGTLRLAQRARFGHKEHPWELAAKRPVPLPEGAHRP